MPTNQSHQRLPSVCMPRVPPPSSPRTHRTPTVASVRHDSRAGRRPLGTGDTGGRGGDAETTRRTIPMTTTIRALAMAALLLLLSASAALAVDDEGIENGLAVACIQPRASLWNPLC